MKNKTLIWIIVVAAVVVTAWWHYRKHSACSNVQAFDNNASDSNQPGRNIRPSDHIPDATTTPATGAAEHDMEPGTSTSTGTDGSNTNAENSRVNTGIGFAPVDISSLGDKEDNPASISATNKTSRFSGRRKILGGAI